MKASAGLMTIPVVPQALVQARLLSMLEREMTTAPYLSKTFLLEKMDTKRALPRRRQPLAALTPKGEFFFKLVGVPLSLSHLLRLRVE